MVKIDHSKIHEIKIGDIIVVRNRHSSKVFQLNDIACWEKYHSIKTIGMEEIEFKSWNYKTKKQLQKAIKDTLKKARFIFHNNDKIIIRCRHDSVPYTITTWHGNSYKPKEITQVYFRKMMN